MEKLKLGVSSRSKKLAIASIILSHGNENFGEYWLLYDNGSLATMDHIIRIFPKGRWSRDSENFLWFTLEEDEDE